MATAKGFRGPAPQPSAQPSVFGEILQRLQRVGGVVAAALVDPGGETVDLATDGDPFEVKVAAAEWQLVMNLVRRVGAPEWPPATELQVRAKRSSFSVFSIDKGYCLVCVLRRHAFEVSRRAVSAAIRELVAEAGWGANPPAPKRPSVGPERWSPVEVQLANSDSRRPAAVWHEGDWQQLNILGRYAAVLRRGEVAYRAQLESGAEMTLVREPLGCWYADL